MQQKFTAYIHMKEGEDLLIEIAQDEDAARNAVARFEQLMASNFLPLSMDGKLLLLATSNILRVEIEPAFGNIPLMVVRNVKKKG